MTVSSAIASATFNYTGAELSFAPGFQALAAGDISVTWANAAGASGALTLNTNFTVNLDANNLVTVAVVAFPAAPLTITIARNSTALQASVFQDGVPVPSSIFQLGFDLCALRDQELRRDIGAYVGLIAAETVRAETAEALAATNLAAETTRALAAEAAERTRALAAEAAETARALAAEGVVSYGQRLIATSLSVIATPWLVAQLGVPSNPGGLAVAPPGSAGAFYNNGGYLCVTSGGSLPTTNDGTPGRLWNNGGYVCVNPGGSNALPLVLPSASVLYWDNGGYVCIS